MATTLLRRGLRIVVSKGLVEKGGPTFSSVIGVMEPMSTQSNLYQHQLFQVARRMYSKRSVHHSRTSASLNESSDCESDSDSDDEQEKGESLFWRRKMRTLHNHLDVNQDGVISYDDFMLLEERFSKLGHLSSDAKQEFRKVLKEMWEEQWGEITPYNLISVEKYLERMHHVLNDDSLKRKYHHFLPFLFKAVDKDKSGEISIEEFKLFFKCLGLTHDHAVVSFSHIDTNDDGKLSLEEFVTLGRDFFITEDTKKPSKHFWGPLVD